MSIDWEKVKSGAREKDRQQYDSMKSNTARLQAVETERRSRAEMVQLQNQRRQAQADLDTGAIMDIDKRLKELRRQSGQQTVGDRWSDILSGSVKGTASGVTNAAGVAADLLHSQSYRDRQIKRLRETLETGRTSDGKTLSATQRASIQKAIGDLTEGEASRIYSAADRMAEESAQDIRQAKEGLGKAGQLLVDVGVAGTQMAGDMLLGAATGGGALVPMAVRGFGGAAQEARQAGATLGQQVAYGAGSAAVSVATEKLSNIAAPFKKAFGAGVLDKTMERLSEKLGQNAAVKMALSAAGEGIEEALEDVAQPILQRATYDPEALVHYKDPEYWANTLYDGLVGAVLGGVGAAVSPSTYAKAGRGAAVESPGAAESVAEGNVTPQAQKPIQGGSGDVMVQEAQRLFGQQKAAPGAEAAYRASYDPMEAAAIMKDAKTFRNLVAGFDTSVSEFFSKWKNGRKVQQGDKLEKLYIGKLSEDVQQQVSNILGYHVDGRDVIITNDDVKHIFDHHGDPTIEISKDNLPLERWAIDALPDVVTQPDSVTPGEIGKGKKDGGKQGVVFSKTFPGGRVVTVQFDNKGRGVMEIKTMYVKGEDTTSVPYEPASAESSALRPERTEPVSSPIDSTIPQGAEFVNPEDIPVDSPEGRQTFPHLNRMFDEASVKGHTDTAGGLGAADAGFTIRGMEGREQTSRFAESMPYDRFQEAATGLSREDYSKIFRYQSQTEANSLHQAEELLYFQQDGQRRFLLDVDPTAFSELLQSLDDATAWNGPQMDAARMILDELKGRSVNMEIESETYTNFLRSMREHGTSTGQGVQANAKWSRRDNSQGQATELDALENLEKSRLPKEEQQRLFRRILQWDMEVQNAQDGDTAALKRIIIEVAQERGVLSGILTKRQSGMMTKVADSALDSLTFDQLRQFAYSSTAALSTDSSPANIGQKVKTIQVLNMLSNPKTAAKNLTGNTSFYVLDAAAMRGAAILDMAVSKLTGTRSVAMERFALGKSSLRDAAKAAQMAIAEITLDVDMGGEQTRYGTGSKRTFKASGNIVERALSAIERNQGYLLNATDEFYKGAARGTQAAAQNLVDAGKIKTDNADYAAQQADQLAKYRTFQDSSKVSTGIQTIHDVLNMIGVGDSGRTVGGQTVHSFGAGDIVAPFTKVAGNLVSRGLEYSPVNAVKGAVEIVEQVARAAGGKTVDPAAQAKGVSNLARGMTGTAIAYGFMLLAKSGLLRQAEDEDDPDVAALNQSEGMTGSQINISAARRALNGGTAQWQAGDTLVDLSSIEPLNLLLNLGTEMAKENENPIVTAWNATGKSFFNASAELPVVQGVGNFAKDVMVYHKDPKESLLEEAAKTAVSSVTPNILRAAAKGLDDRPRNVYTGDGLTDLILDSFRNSVPGLREKLPGSVNTLGEEKTYQGSRTDNLLNAMLNPIGVNTYLQSDVSREMERVRQATGSTSFYPSKTIPSKLSYTKNGETVEAPLTYEQRQAYQKVRGQTINQTMASVMKTEAYRRAGSSEQAALLDRCHDYANAIARESVLGSDSVDAWVHHARDAQSEIGKSTAEYLALYEQYGGDIMSGKAYDTTQEALDAGLTIGEYAAYKDSVKGLTADKDANGVSISGTKKEKVIAAIAAQDLSATEKDWLYLLNYDGKNAQKDLRKMPWNQ